MSATVSSAVSTILLQRRHFEVTRIAYSSLCANNSFILFSESLDDDLLLNSSSPSIIFMHRRVNGRCSSELESSGSITGS